LTMKGGLLKFLLDG